MGCSALCLAMRLIGGAGWGVLACMQESNQSSKQGGAGGILSFYLRFLPDFAGAACSAAAAAAATASPKWCALSGAPALSTTVQRMLLPKGVSGSGGQGQEEGGGWGGGWKRKDT